MDKELRLQKFLKILDENKDLLCVAVLGDNSVLYGEEELEFNINGGAIQITVYEG